MCHTLIELVQTGPSLVLKFQEIATPEQIVRGNLSCEISQNSKIPVDLNEVGIEFSNFLAHTLLSTWPPSVLSTRLDKSVYFLLGETVQ